MTVPIESLFYDDAGPHIISVSRTHASRGAGLQSLLSKGIASLTPLNTEPFSAPAALPEEAPPITDFFYRGRAALDRAIELRNEIQSHARQPNADEVEELFALLDLAVLE